MTKILALLPSIAPLLEKTSFHHLSQVIYGMLVTKASQKVVASLDRKGRRWKLRGKRGRGTLEGEKLPVLGMLERNGEVVIQMVPNM